MARNINTQGGDTHKTERYERDTKERHKRSHAHIHKPDARERYENERKRYRDSEREIRM